MLRIRPILFESLQGLVEITDEPITGSIASDVHSYIIYSCADIYDVTHLELHQNRAGSLFIIGQRPVPCIAPHCSGKYREES